MEAKSWIKAYVVQIIPLIAVIIYILGFAYYITYYYQFGINIISYITLSEVLVSTLVPIIVFATSILAISIFNSYIDRLLRLSLSDMQKKSKILYRWIGTKLKISAESTLFSVIKKNKRKTSKVIIHPRVLAFYATLASILGIIIPYNIYVDNFNVPYKYFVICIFIYMSSIIYPNYQQVHRTIKIKSVREYFDVISSFIIFFTSLTCIILLAIYNSEQDKNKNGRRFEITTINNITYTDSIYNYIGECNSMYFLYDKINSNTIIINIDHIHSIKTFNKHINLYENIILDTNDFFKDYDKWKKEK